MAVKISTARPIVACPATLYLPADGGAMVAHKFVVHFRRVSTSERDTLNGRFVKGELTVRELLDSVVVGWEGMQDEKGAEEAYSHAARIAADEAYSGLEQAIGVSWFDHMFVSQRDAAAKNSVAPSVTS